MVSFSLSGPDDFPSAAYAPIDAVNGAGDIHLAREGERPEDGFSGYAPFAPIVGLARWGDYSGAAVDEDGSVWLATEYISPRLRVLPTNWGIFVSNVRLGPSN